MKNVLISCKDLSNAIQAKKNCLRSGNTEWFDKWEDKISDMLSSLPSGSGIDSGIELEEDKCTLSKLVFSFDFHHMNDGCYDGWTCHELIITPSFGGFNIKITGRNRDMIKDYLCDLFSNCFC